MVFGKAQTFVFRKIGILCSSSRIKSSNLRFEDFQFSRIFVNISRTKNLRPKILCSAEDFLVRTIIFFLWKKKTENG